MARRHDGKAVTACRRCGGEMKVGERVAACFSWETGSRFGRDSKAGFICRECAGKWMGEMGLEVPE